MEHGPTTTSRRSSAPWSTRWIAWRASYTVADGRVVHGNSRSRCEGGANSVMSAMRVSSIGYAPAPEAGEAEVGRWVVEAGTGKPLRRKQRENKILPQKGRSAHRGRRTILRRRIASLQHPSLRGLPNRCLARYGYRRLAREGRRR